MSEKISDHEKRQRQVIGLLTANLITIVVGAAIISILFLMESRKIRASVERIETRFHTIADDVQPVVSTGAGKVVEGMENLDVEGISKTLSDKSNALLEAASDKAIDFLKKDPE
ncbi:MAG: hypothetical protein AAGA58_00765 [Verrucomicrobiota bacterium]